MTETDRIVLNNSGERPDKTMMTITIRGLSDPAATLEKAKEVMQCVSQYAYTQTWPDDTAWKNILPRWFVASMTLRTEEELLNDEGQWHFESWVESMYHRAWTWWSSEIKGDQITIVLETLNIPYLFEPLLYVFYAQGVPMDKIEVKDDIYD